MEPIPDLSRLLEDHRAEPFPTNVVKGEGYGEVDAVVIDADIYGWAVGVSRGRPLGVADLTRLRDARDRLRRSLAAFPEDARPYYERLVEIASAALDQSR
jgi:hypothetical protein